MNPGLVSIIVPTYDRSELLRSTLDSLMSQIYSNFEIIVVDDGSPDDKTKILCESYSKVKYLRIKNSGGPARPRNEGIRLAGGDFIAFVDDDDIWLENKLSKQISILESQPETDLVHHCCQLISEEGELLDEIIGRPGRPEEKSGQVYMRMIGNWTLMTSSVVLRKILVEKVGFFNEQMAPAGEDMEYWARCALYGSFYYMDEPLVLYRKHSGISTTNLKKYQALPGQLMNTVDNARVIDLINGAEYRQLKQQIIRMQIKKIHLGWIVGLGKLFRLDPFWVFNLNNLKLLIRKLGSGS
jgi:glycosyltransferase involved in cell wall biosynthesis